MTEQVDHRDMDKETIKERVLIAESGDEVRFNDRIKPLDVLESESEYIEVEITVRTASGREVIFDHPVNDGIDWTVGEELYLPGFEDDEQPVTVEHVSELGEKFDKYALVLEGPQGGKYHIFSKGNEVKVRHESGDQPFPPMTVYWFENITRGKNIYNP